MKICLYNVTSTMDLPGTHEVGGTEEFSFRVAEAWQRMGHEVVIVGGEPKPGASTRQTPVPLKLFPYLETAGIPNLGSRFRKLIQRIHFSRRALKYVKSEAFELVLAFKPYDLPPFWLAGLSKRARVLFRFGGTDFFPTDRFWSGAANACFANSRSTADKVQERYHRGCAVIGNGAIVPERAAVIDERVQTVLSAGRLTGWKGFGTLIEAASPLRNRKGWKLVIAGEGEYRPKLEAVIEEFGLKEKVELPGRMPAKEIQDLMRQGALYVQPSTGYDSCPNAVMDAMAAGLPVVISSEVGTPEGFEPGRHGLVFPAGNQQALFEQMIRFLNHPADFARMGEAGRKLVQERFTLDKIAWEILELAKSHVRDRA